MKKILFILFTLYFSFTQCKREDEIPTFSLESFNQIDEFSDTILFREIECLTFHDDKIYLSNTMYDQMVSLDLNLNLINIFGERGQGPNELLSIGRFAIQDTTMSVLNLGNGRINIFSTEGSVISETKVSDSILFDPTYRFAFLDTLIIGSSSVSDDPLLLYNIYTKEQILFGEAFEFSTPKQTAIRNKRHIAIIKNNLFSVSNNLPIIEKYNLANFNQVSKYDYSDIPFVKESINAIESKQNVEDNSYYVLCDDIYNDGIKLYVLVSEFTNNNYIKNKIIQFNTVPNIKPECIYKLSGKIYDTFCVSEEHQTIYAYNKQENTIEAYRMDSY